MLNIKHILLKYIKNTEITGNTHDFINLKLFLLTYRKNLLQNKNTNILYTKDNKYNKFYINTPKLKLELDMCNFRDCFLEINDINYLLNYIEQQIKNKRLEGIIEGGNKYNVFR